MRDDTISRQAAIDALKVAYWDNDIQSAKDDPCIVDAMTDWAIRQIKALPSAERHGRWERVGDVSFRCSVCGEVSCCNSPFCSECGAKMDEVEE